MIRRASRHSVKDRIIMAVLLLVIVWFLLLIFNIAKKEEIARKAAEEAQREFAALQERHATLEQNLAELSTERGEEAMLRETYGVARPGEEVIIVVPEEEQEELPPLPWWRKFFGWFGL